jgi:hypothetical protein
MSLAVTGLVQMLTTERVLGYKNMEINIAAEPETATKSTYNIPISQYKYQHYVSHQELLCKSFIPFINCAHGMAREKFVCPTYCTGNLHNTCKVLQTLFLVVSIFETVNNYCTT